MDDITNHPRGNYWFADQLIATEPGFRSAFPWAVFIQLPGLVHRLDVGFQTEESAEQFIRDDILGAGAEFEHDPA